MDRKGFSLVEMMVALGLGVMVIMLLMQFFVRSSKETSGAGARAARDADWGLASGAVQRSMTSSFHFMARGGSAGSSSMRALIPLVDRCRDLSACPGALSLVYAVPRRKQQETWNLKQADGIPDGLMLSFEASLFPKLSAGLKAGQLVSVFVVPYAPLFFVKTTPAISKAQLAGDLAPQDYVRFEVQPFDIPVAWRKDLATTSSTDFTVLNAPGAGLLALELQSAGPARSMVGGKEVWSFGSRACRASTAQVVCDGPEMPSVQIDGLKDFSVSASWRRSLSPVGVCASAQIFWDLASRKEPGLEPCASAPADAGIVRFEDASTYPLSQALVPDENPGALEARGLSLMKFEIVSGLKFKMRLARPFPNQPEGADNPNREVTFHVQFP
jgi:prepilin-type N-terminal cleavage/methylation domain-containing protein